MDSQIGKQAKCAGRSQEWPTAISGKRASSCAYQLTDGDQAIKANGETIKSNFDSSKKREYGGTEGKMELF